MAGDTYFPSKNIKFFAYEWSPYTFNHEVNNRTAISGTVADLVNYFTKSLNYTYTVYSEIDDWGICNKNRSSMDSLRKCILYHKVFYLLLLTMSLLFATILVFDLVARNFERPTKFRLFEYLWHIYATFLFKCSELKMSSAALKFMTLVWIVGSFIFFNMYSGEMTSSFFLKQTPPFITSIDDFYKFPHVTPMVWDDTTVAAYLKDKKATVYKEIWRRILAAKSFINLDDLLFGRVQLADKVFSAKYSWIGLKTDIDFLLRQSDVMVGCSRRNFHITKPVTNAILSLTVRKDMDATFVEEMNKRILHMQQSDILDNEFYDSKSDYRLCVDKPILPGAKTLVTRDLGGLFVLWSCGLVLSTLIFIVERIRPPKLSARSLRRKSLRMNQIISVLEEHKFKCHFIQNRR